jgi:hypothetical protein
MTSRTPGPPASSSLVLVEHFSDSHGATQEGVAPDAMNPTYLVSKETGRAPTRARPVDTGSSKRGRHRRPGLIAPMDIAASATRRQDVGSRPTRWVRPCHRTGLRHHHAGETDWHVQLHGSARDVSQLRSRIGSETAHGTWHVCTWCDTHLRRASCDRALAVRLRRVRGRSALEKSQFRSRTGSE